MSTKVSRGIRIGLSVLIGIVLVLLLWQSSSYSPSASASMQPLNYPIALIPDQQELSGDIATSDNCNNPTVCSWFQDMPEGSVILGVDPSSANPDDWDGGSVTTELSLSDVHFPTVLVLKLSWPDFGGKGLHSPDKNQMGMITLDGNLLWGKSTDSQSTFGDYYGAEHEPIVTTIVITESVVHNLTISVSPHTAWDLSLIELIAYPFPDLVRGIGYSPYRDCQGPGTFDQPTTENIQEDLFQLLHTSNAIRTYASDGVNNQVPGLANDVGMPVYVGAWLDAGVNNPDYETKLEADNAEIEALIELANTTDLAGAIVGNEFYLRNRASQDLVYLRNRIVEVRNGVNNPNLPLMTAEIESFMFDWQSGNPTGITGIKPAYRPILDEVDIVLVHIYPFWAGLPIDGAAAFTVDRYKAIRDLIAQEYPGKRVIIGETGWPSSGGANGVAVPSLANQRRYMLEFMLLAEQENVEYMYFDAFDELWKVEEPRLVGQHWGYSGADRKAKHNFYGVLIPTAQLSDMGHLEAVTGIESPVKSPLVDFLYLPVVLRLRAYLANLVYLPVIINQREPFPVYTEWLHEDHFVPSGLMGDIDNITMYECDRSNPHSGELAIRATFSPTGTLGWGGVYWQNPANNWGDLEGGHDLTGAKRLTFWIRGDQGGEVVEFLVGGIGEPSDPNPDSIQPAISTGPLVLSNTWQQVAIPLTGADLSRVVGGFAWVANKCQNAEPITFYIDDVFFEFNSGNLPPSLLGPDNTPFYIYDEAESSCNHFVPSGWMGDLDDISLDVNYDDDTCDGETAIQVGYGAQGLQGWAGIYWQEPEDNWGTEPEGGYELDVNNALVFCAKGESGGEVIQFGMGGLGRHPGTCAAVEPYPDSACKTFTNLVLTNQWKEYVIDLTTTNLDYVIGGFLWVAEQANNPGGATFYLDEIRYEANYQFPPTPTPTATPTLPTATPTPTTLPTPSQTPTPGAFYVYEDYNSPLNHFIPSGWMGDMNNPDDFDDAYTGSVCSGSSAIRITYPATGSNGWAGIYWQEPENNWGNIPNAGYNLTSFNTLTFCAKGTLGGEIIEFGMGGLGRNPQNCQPLPDAPYPDSTCKVSTFFTLTNQWQEYNINLTGHDLSYIIGGFLWVATQSQNPGGATFFLDNIRYEMSDPTPTYTPSPPPTSTPTPSITATQTPSFTPTPTVSGTPTATPSITPTPTPTDTPTPTPMPDVFYVYNDYGSQENHFTPSGWMGDMGNPDDFNDAFTGSVCSGSTAIRITYPITGSNGWAGIYWQEPENNWGTQPDAGFDLSQYNALVFCAKGEIGGEIAEFGMGGIGRDPDNCQPDETYPDSACKTSIEISLTDEWQEYVVPLSSNVLTHTIGGFLWAAAQDNNPGGATFLLDDIRYETITLPPTPMPDVFYIYEDYESVNNHFVPSGWMGSIGDITLTVTNTTTVCSGTSAIQVSYSGEHSWAGIYWQEPDGNWGTIPDAGYDLRQYHSLVFCAKGEVGGEYIEFGMGGMGRSHYTCEPTEPYPDSSCKTSTGIFLTDVWQEYAINLPSQALTRTIGGFLWVAARYRNPNGATFYVDDIRYEKDGWAEVGAGSASFRPVSPAVGGISNTPNNSVAPSIAIAVDGMLYVTWQEYVGGNNEIYIRRWNGMEWEEVGNGSASGGGISNTAGSSSFPSIAITAEGIPFVTWGDSDSGNSEIYIRRWNGMEWEEVGNDSASGGGISNTAGSSSSPSIAIAAEGIPFVTWGDSDSGNSEIYIRRWNGVEWEEVGNGSASGGGISNTAGSSSSPSIAITVEGIPYVTWRESIYFRNVEIYIQRWNGLEWEEIGGISAADGGISRNIELSSSSVLAIDPNNLPIIAWADRHTYDIHLPDAGGAPEIFVRILYISED